MDSSMNFDGCITVNDTNVKHRFTYLGCTSRLFLFITESYCIIRRYHSFSNSPDDGCMGHPVSHWPWWIKLLWTLMYKSSRGYIFSFLSCKYGSGFTYIWMNFTNGNWNLREDTWPSREYTVSGGAGVCPWVVQMQSAWVLSLSLKVSTAQGN